MEAAETLSIVEEYRRDLAVVGEIIPIYPWQETELSRRQEHPPLQKDVAQVFQWYEGQRPGRGQEFLDCVHAGLEAIRRKPTMNPIVFLNIRRCLLRPFPFAVFYQCQGAKVSVFGVLPISSDPKKWQPADQTTPANRLPQAVLILAILLGSWLGMQIVHEFGHVLGGWLTGGQVARVVLYPLTISRTDWATNPHPLIVAWSGPMLGVLLPLAGWLLLRHRRGAYLIRFFAGFCCIANGAYIAGGSLDRLGDAGDLLRHGSPISLLWLFGLTTILLGLWLWHRQGQHFGLGPARGKVSVRAAYGTLVAVVMVMILEFLFSFRD
jgi:hypothetical protein